MTALLQGRQSPKIGLDTVPNYPSEQGFPVAAGVTLFTGAIQVLATSGANAGNVVPGGQATGICIGIGERMLVNATGAAGALTTQPRSGCFLMGNSAGADAITYVNIGAPCYVVDDQTVALTDGGGTRSVAGTITAIETGSSQFANGVWVTFGVPYGMVGAASTQSGVTAESVRVARGVVTANVASLSAFTVAGNDGLTYVAGDRVLLAGQTTASQNGLYTVGTVTAGTAALTRTTDWATGAIVPSGTKVTVNQGTVWALSEWKLTTAAPITVDTTAEAFYPRIVKGNQALTAGAATVANQFILATAAVSATDTTAANATKATLTAGQGTGSIALAGTTTDTLSYIVVNW